MNWKVAFAIATVPFLLGNGGKEEDVIKRFLAAVAAGGGYLKQDFADTPTVEEIGFLASLKECKNISAETVTGKNSRGWALEWKCPVNPKLRVAIAYIVDGKIDRILQSDRIGRP